MKPPYLSLLVPIFNEKQRLLKDLASIVAYLKTKKYSWEIILVDDGSTDTTGNIIAQFSRKHPHIYSLRTSTNFGKGHAVRLGVAAASGAYIMFTDIDLSVPLTFTPIAIQALKNYHLVIGSRRLKTSKITLAQNSLRQSLGHGFTKLSNLVLGLNHTDYTCGFKAFRREVARKLFNKLRANRWAFDAEILYLAHQHKYSVKEIPVTWKNDPRTKVSLTTDILQSAFDLLRIRF